MRQRGRSVGAFGVVLGVCACTGGLVGCSSGGSAATEEDGGADASGASATFASTQTSSGNSIPLASTSSHGSSSQQTGTSSTSTPTGTSGTTQTGTASSTHETGTGTATATSTQETSTGTSHETGTASQSSSSTQSVTGTASSGQQSSTGTTGSSSVSLTSTGTGSQSSSASSSSGASSSSSASSSTGATSNTGSSASSSNTGSSPSSSNTGSSSSSGATSTGSSSNSSSSASLSSTSNASTSTTADAGTSSTTADAGSSATSTGSSGVACTDSDTCNAGLSCLGGACLPPTILLLAGSGTASSLTGATFQAAVDAGVGSWVTTALDDATSFGASLTVDSSGRGIGLYTSTSSDVSYTVWSGNAWSSTATVGTGVTSIGQPFLDATGSSTTYATYLTAPSGPYEFFSLTFSGSTWSSPIALGPSGNQYYGPVPPTIAALAPGATAGFIDGEDSDWAASTDFDLSLGTWDTLTDISGAPENYDVPPSIIPLSVGTTPDGGPPPELLLTFIAYNPGTQIYYQTRTAGNWAAPQVVTGCSSYDRVALAPLPGGGAILAFVGTDSNLYWSVFSDGAWSPVAPFASPNVSVDSDFIDGAGYGTPGLAVTHGIGTDIAELAYITDGVAYSSSLTAGVTTMTWSAPVPVGLSNLSAIAIASSP